MAGLVLAIESSGTAVRSEMLASILIICFSLVMVVYWFRYCCALVLRNSQEQLDALPAISDSRFDVSGVIERLQTEEKLASLHQALDRDYQVFTYLVQHAAGLELSSLEDRLLLLNYRFIQLWYRFALRLAPQQAREALGQMATILNVLVHKMSHQAGLHVEA